MRTGVREIEISCGSFLALIVWQQETQHPRIMVPGGISHCTHQTLIMALHDPNAVVVIRERAEP